MRLRFKTWLVPCLLLLLLGGFLWHFAKPSAVPANPVMAAKPAAPVVAAVVKPVAVKKPAVLGAFPMLGQSKSASAANAILAARAAQFHYRLSNTPKTVGQLARSGSALLLENALIDTASGQPLDVPANLRSDNPGSYIIQAKGPVDAAFRSALAAAGATIVSYIPNDAYLVAASQTGAQQMAANPETQTVQPFEPYFKLQAGLLQDAVEQPVNTGNLTVSLLLFPGQQNSTLNSLQQLGYPPVFQENSGIGQIVVVQMPVSALPAVAGLPGVHEMELAHKLAPANDLARVAIGISTDPQTTTNYLNLTGTNVIVNVNDFGFDITHPDLKPRITLDPADYIGDTNGHGTHVSGIIIGSGFESTTVSNAPGSPSPITNFQFRGKAPQATIYGITLNALFNDDSYIQSQAAQTNALISNNSWGEDGVVGYAAYDLTAASYDAAVRDALPGVTGSQPLTYVFAAGNDGFNPITGTSSTADTINSPGAAKNVITVGATDQLRDLTNIVQYYTTGVDTNGNPITMTNFITPFVSDSDDTNVAPYSSLGNVGIGTEGESGRFKPDVVAPGSWVISDRSEQWNQNGYYNPTSVDYSYYPDQVLQTNSEINSSEFILGNAVQVEIQLLPNNQSPIPFPNLPIYTSSNGVPATTGTPSGTNTVILNAGNLQNGLLYYSVTNVTQETVNYDVLVTVFSTNDYGNEFQVLSNMNNTLGPWYRYESGTSMATPAVSGMLALMEDFFSNRVAHIFSPALMKALVINGARSLAPYDFNVQSTTGTAQGWGLVNLPTSLPGLLTNVLTQTIGTPTSMLLFDQNPTNALATGQSITYNIAVTNAAQEQPLRFTLVWTDPPGDPAAGIKLVNDLDLIVTNLDTGVVYYGNNIDAGSIFNEPWDTNNLPAYDSVKDFVNNVENVYIAEPFGTNFSVTVSGYRVNVNAVTAQTNTLANGVITNAPNVVQDYALVISSGDGAITNAITLNASNGPTAVLPTTNNLTYLNPIETNNTALLFGQIVGANSPLLGTNILVGDTNLEIGQVNQWSFYVFTNTAAATNASFTNVAFGTFNAVTMSVPREGVFAPDLADATRPDADADLYVSTDPGLTNLNPAVLSNCVLNVYDSGYASSLGSGGSETVTFTNSTGNEVYYVAVQSQDQMAVQYDFFGVATTNGFGQQQPNGDIIVTPQIPVLPAAIPDAGGPSQPGALQMICIVATPNPITIGGVIVTNFFEHQLPSDLIGTLTHGGKAAVLNNHTIQTQPTSFNDPFLAGDPSFSNGGTNQFLVYNDSGQEEQNTSPAAKHSDGPGNLNNFMNTGSSGQWMLNMVDSVHTHVGYESNLVLRLIKQPDTNVMSLDGLCVGNEALGFVEVPIGATNLALSVVGNDQPIAMLIRLNNYPSFGPPAFYDYTNYFPATNINGTATINISLNSNPPLQAGTYYVLVENVGSECLTRGNVFANISFGAGAENTQAFTSSNAVPLLDDAVTDGSISVTNTNSIAAVSVGVRIASPRESDLALTLISPEGDRILLAENRGGTDTNGYGGTQLLTNSINSTANGGALPQTNVIAISTNSGTLQVVYNFYTQPDEMTIYYGTNITPANLILDTGYTNNPPDPGYTSQNAGSNTVPETLTVTYPPPGVPATATAITIVMNQFGNTNGTSWTYSAQSVTPNYEYFWFTDETNDLLNPLYSPVPLMKFAPPPFEGTEASIYYAQPEETLDAVQGEFANGSGEPGQSGIWQLEVWDSRTGAFLPTGNQLVSWQLSFIYANSLISASGTNGIVFVTTPTNLTVVVSNTITVTNAAIDLNTNNTLTYSLLNPPAGATINPTNGVITFTPTAPGIYTNTTVVTDNGTPPASATNSFTVTVVSALAPFAATLPPTQISITSATFNGLATANAATGLAWFQWGSSDIFGSNPHITAPQNVSGEDVTPESVHPVLNIGGESTQGTYYYQLVVSNSAGITYGSIQVIALGGQSVWAWGDDTYGQTNVPASLTNAVTIAAGGYHSLAIDDSDTIWAWGDNSAGQLGITNQPQPNLVGISAGLEHSLGLTTSGTVQGWGDNTYGEINIPAGLTNVISIASGSYHNLALKNDGTVVAWGYNYFGQTNVPVGLSNVVAVAAGGLHSLALENNGTVVAWGDNTFGQTSVPGGLSNVWAIAAGGAHSVALTTNGTMVAWGASPDGETDVSFFAGQTVTMITAELDHSLAVYNNDSSVFGWGFDSSYDNEPNNYGLYFTAIQAVAAGGYHNLLLGARSTEASPVGGPTGGGPVGGIQAEARMSPIFQVDLTWQASTNSAFMVQWAPTVSTGGWRTLTNVITSTNGIFNFIDDGSQTGGSSSERFYRLMRTQSP